MSFSKPRIIALAGLILVIAVLLSLFVALTISDPILASLTSEL